MMNARSIKLDLIENSHAFFVEAAQKAIGAEDDIRHWQFAILNLVQSLELTLKAMLRDIHPILIYENIDNPKHTISITKAIERLADKNIGNILFSKQELEGMSSAIKLRNNITHSDFELSIDHAQAQFLKVLELYIKIQRVHLSRQIEDILPKQVHEELLAIEKSKEALIKNALQRTEEQGIPSNDIWTCPNCLSDTFVVYDGLDTCYACTFKDELQECPSCHELFFEHELESISQYFDTDLCEGEVILHNTYGYDFYQACNSCSEKIKEDIQEQRDKEHYDFLEREYYMR